MSLLILGIVVWSVLHLFKAVTPSARASLIARTGEVVYKVGFALLIVLSIVLMVMGWRASTAELLYFAPAELRHLTFLLMLLAMILFVASAIPSDIKRLIRHPQLSAVIVWAIAHLLSNGESRSVVLFGGMAVWAILEIIFINRRDGVWLRPDSSGWVRILIPLVIAVLVYGVVVYFHASIAGVALFG